MDRRSLLIVDGKSLEGAQGWDIGFMNHLSRSERIQAIAIAVTIVIVGTLYLLFGEPAARVYAPILFVVAAIFLDICRTPLG